MLNSKPLEFISINEWKQQSKLHNSTTFSTLRDRYIFARKYHFCPLPVSL